MVAAMELPSQILLRERYRIEKVIGSGGYGITYKAFDQDKGQICAVKEYVPSGYSIREGKSCKLRSTSSATTEIYEYGKLRFIEEARVLIQLQNISSVVNIYDCFYENGTAYYVMEFIDGETLNHMRASRPEKRLSFQECYDIIVKTAICLDQVHTQGNIFHRDISPENIMVKKDGSIKIIDFGTAKQLNSMKTQNFSIILKPGYAPPEQYISTAKQGEYTDVYALAATFYYVLTGKKVPPSPERLSLGAEFTSVSQILEKDYHVLDKILVHALEISISDRTSNMREFLAELRTINPVIEEPQITYASDHHPYLDGVTGIVKDLRYVLPCGEEIMIGREQENQLLIASSIISRRHAEIFFDPYNQNFYIKDLGSANGTFVNGFRCPQNQIVVAKVGDILALANNECVFRLGVRDD